MSQTRHIRIGLSAGLLVLSVVLLCAALFFPGSSDTAGQARRVERRLQKRLALLETYVSRGPSAGKLPPDMVIYRYVDDSLYAWSNQFPVRNDDIHRSIRIERLSGYRSALDTPLADLPDSFRLVSLGPKWFLIRAQRSGPATRLEGLELDNVRLGLGDRFSIRPLATSGGSVVQVAGKPCFKILCDNVREPGAIGARKGGWAVLLLYPLSLALFLLSLGLHLARLRVPLAVVLPAVVLIAGYSFLALRSLILDAGVSLELYKFGELNSRTLLSYAAFLLLFCCIPLLLSSARLPVLGLRARLAWALAAGLYLMLATALLGFRKEQEKVSLWAERLSVERDSTLESQLQQVEEAIALDPVIAEFSLTDAGPELIRNRIAESYLPRISPIYRIRVMALPPGSVNPAGRRLLRSVLSSGKQIAGQSRFLYTIRDGQASYDGVFSYAGERPGEVSFVLVEVEPVAGVRSRGYARLLGLSETEGVQMPGFYSYARYDAGRMIYCQGSYAYPTAIDGDFSDRGGYLHFLNHVAGGDALIVISRPRISSLNYVFSTLFLSVLMFLLLSLFPFGRKKVDRRDYFRTRINWVVMLSLTVTLVVMAVVSVFFVYRRNEVNQQGLLADKVLMLQRMVRQSGGSLPVALERAAAEAGVDLTLYAPDGKLVASTAREVFDRLLAGCRMNETAFDQIVHQKRRYFTQREVLAGRDYMALYAPLLDADGKLVGVLCSPHTERSYDFVREAMMHLMAILTVFIILLILARVMVMGMLDRIFHPLLEMGRRMVRAGSGALEPIEYDREDEISSLIKAYNDMVQQLEESRATLAQAERDKAWSAMARQVAHEIKNPLTPMKLQLQRIIRLKEKGGDQWQEKFDEMAAVLLEHIEILTQTANEFSDFAKLYVQEPVRMDLNRLLEDEIAMFDGREGVEFSYFGLEGAEISGPKPQLTRVFVNLINNSVQALEGVPDAKVVVSLRKSAREDALDIVFEDNGPGVSEENRDRLFTPNFTTKNGGTGLGLAISKSVLERCGASITYSRSFTLGGACFTICYPAGLPPTRTEV